MVDFGPSAATAPIAPCSAGSPRCPVVVVHELGHGVGRTIGGIGYFTQEIEYAVHFENVYRQLTTSAEQWPTIRLYECWREELSEYSRRRNVTLPEELGGGTAPALSKVYPVR